MTRVLKHLQRLKNGCWDAISSRFTRWTKPLPLGTSLPLATVADLSRSKSELIAENALLRQQLIILKRQVKRPVCTKADRVLLVLLARLVRKCQQALVIVQPDTLLRWHRDLFRRNWKRMSKASAYRPKVASETIALIKQMATENRLWGAERIRGELQKLGIRVCKRTIQKYMRTVRTTPPRGKSGAQFPATTQDRSGHVTRLQVTDLFFRPVFAFFMIELKSRKVIHVEVTRAPTDAWVARTAARSHPLWTNTKVSDS